MSDDTTPDGDLLTEIRALRATFETAVDQVNGAVGKVGQLRTDLDALAHRSNRRARIFTVLWVIVFLAAATAFYLGNDNNKDANRKLGCFQTWANATADRTQTITAASNQRIKALNYALDVIADNQSQQVRTEAIKAAALAGDQYEQVALANPPIPAALLNCR